MVGSYRHFVVGSWDKEMLPTVFSAHPVCMDRLPPPNNGAPFVNEILETDSTWH